MRIDNQMAGFRVPITKHNDQKIKAGRRPVRSSSDGVKSANQFYRPGTASSSDQFSQPTQSSLYNDNKIKRAINALVSDGTF